MVLSTILTCSAYFVLLHFLLNDLKITVQSVALGLAIKGLQTQVLTHMTPLVKIQFGSGVWHAAGCITS